MQIPKSYSAGVKAGALAGILFGIAFWIYSLYFLHSPFPSRTSDILGALLGFMFFGVLYSFFYVWLYNKLPGKNAVIKAEVLVLLPGAIDSSIALLITHTVHVLSIASGLPIFILFGFLFGTFYSILAKTSSPMMRKMTGYFIVIFVVALLLGLFIISYQRALEPVSFTASDIHFVTNNGNRVVANITDRAQASIISVMVTLDGLNEGSCRTNITTNQTQMCSAPPSGRELLSCAQLTPSVAHTLSLEALFDNLRTTSDNYTISDAQLGG